MKRLLRTALVAGAIQLAKILVDRPDDGVAELSDGGEGEEVDGRLQTIMKEIHDKCAQYGDEGGGYIDYVKGANIAGFVKVADAMVAYGAV